MGVLTSFGAEVEDGFRGDLEFSGDLGAGLFLGAEGGDLFAGRFYCCASLLAECVDGRGVPEFAGEIGQDCIEHFRLDGRRGVEIEVDAIHKTSHRILPAGESCLLPSVVVYAGLQDNLL